MAIQIFPKTSMRGSFAQPAPDCIPQPKDWQDIGPR
jgi:hypothetical protein